MSQTADQHMATGVRDTKTDDNYTKQSTQIAFLGKIFFEIERTQNALKQGTKHKTSTPKGKVSKI